MISKRNDSIESGLEQWYNSVNETRKVAAMYPIKDKRQLTPTVSRISVFAPDITRHAKAGQFVMLRVAPDGERIPMTIADVDKQAGTVSIIFQVVGASTHQLNQLDTGDHILDFVGPLGKPTAIEGLSKVAVIGGGVGCAIAYPTAKALHGQGTRVDAFIGFRNKELVILEDDFKKFSHHLTVMTDDGSYGEQGFVTDALKKALDQGKTYDEIFAIGPLPMMKAVSELTKPYGIKTTVSMNPIMVDGTGMCGGCRVTVAGKMKFACVDGPDFDGHAIDFDEAIRRNRMYASFEQKQYEKACRLKEDNDA